MADEFVIESAERDQSKLRFLLQGPSGGGKTTSSLLIARGIVKALGARQLLSDHLAKHIGLICTERGSARKAAHITPFDLLVLGPPYTPARFIGALTAMERVGYSVIIIDQITHEWTGPGGVLAMVAAAKGINDFSKWDGPSQEHEAFIDRLLTSPAHLICTARAKTEYVLEDKEVRGQWKKVPVRIGMQAKQRAGTEFEFDTVLDLTPGTNAIRCIKDRCELFVVDEVVPRLDVLAGERFIEWVYSATAAAPAAAEPTPEERARAMTDAAVRGVGTAPNLPDLETIYLREKEVLREFARTAGRDVMLPLLAELGAAKDQRKTFLGAGATSPQIVRDLDPAEVARPAKEPVQKDPREVLDKTIEKIAGKRPGLFTEQKEQGTGFDDMKDDLPWQD